MAESKEAKIGFKEIIVTVLFWICPYCEKENTAELGVVLPEDLVTCEHCNRDVIVIE